MESNSPPEKNIEPKPSISAFHPTRANHLDFPIVLSARQECSKPLLIEAGMEKTLIVLLVTRGAVQS